MIKYGNSTIEISIDDLAKIKLAMRAMCEIKKCSDSKEIYLPEKLKLLLDIVFEEIKSHE